MSLARWTLVSVLLILNSSWVECNECNDGEYAPDPYDCNGYLQCQFGRWVQRNCAETLHFNRFILACDFPWNARCELLESTTTSTTTTPEDPTPTPTGSPPTAPPTGSPPTEPPTGSPPTEPPTGSPPTEPPTGSPPTEPPTGSPPTEPPTGSPPTEPPTGSPPTEPPTGSPPTEPPTVTPPTTTTITGPPGFTTTTTTTWAPTTTTWAPTHPPTTTTLLPTLPPILDCTPTDGTYVLHLPHPNCTMFYKCVHGVPHEMLCPIAQHWAIALDRCESPSEANCVDGAAREQYNARPPGYW